MKLLLLICFVMALCASVRAFVDYDDFFDLDDGFEAYYTGVDLDDGLDADYSNVDRSFMPQRMPFATMAA